MSEIRKVAVIGSGVMGGAIAAHVANAGIEVMLLDIVPKDATDRNMIAKGAIEKMLKASPCPFAHPRNAKKVAPGNLEDDLKSLKDCDWIIEAVIEKPEIKHDVYEKIEKHRKKGSAVSSNTSTLPLATLTKGLPTSFAQDFMITHFFNPPRFMPLLELVTSPATDAKKAAVIRAFCDKNLGKGVVDCKDTPGFIANRIGAYWLFVALNEAMRLGISIEDADNVMGKPVGFPKTGVFGLFDLIGIDLMPLIAQSLLATLPKNDDFRKIYDEPALVKAMIAEGYTGRKGKGGFYRINKDGGRKVKEVKNLATGAYAPERTSSLESAEAARGGLAALLTHPDIGGQYAWAVLSKTLSYAASLVPEIADDITAVDDAMRMGYNWKYGPFEMIDRLKADGMAGPRWFAGQLAKHHMPVPALLQQAGSESFYKEEGTKRLYLNLKGKHAEIPTATDAWSLADLKRGNAPLEKNGSATLWNVGDGILCLELTSKMNTIETDVISMIAKSTEIAANDYKGLIVGGDGNNFSVGANLGFLLYAANLAAWDMIDGILKQGQDAYMGMKYAPVPVVAALHGMALGGGCEITLHCDAAQAHLESYPGLVEMGVGLIPGWGGCKELVVRYLAASGGLSYPKERGKEAAPALSPRSGASLRGQESEQGANIKPARIAGGPMPAISRAFEMIALAKVAGSAQEAFDFGILNQQSRITMNRKRLLADAKALCLELAENYTPPPRPELHLPGATGKAAIEMGLEGFVATGKASEHDAFIGKEIAYVLTGGNCDITDTLTEQRLLDLEREAFARLIRTDKTLARIEHMLEVGKPLRN